MMNFDDLARGGTAPDPKLKSNNNLTFTKSVTKQRPKTRAVDNDIHDFNIELRNNSNRHHNYSEYNDAFEEFRHNQLDEDDYNHVIESFQSALDQWSGKKYNAVHSSTGNTTTSIDKDVKQGQSSAKQSSRKDKKGLSAYTQNVPNIILQTYKRPTKATNSSTRGTKDRSNSNQVNELKAAYGAIAPVDRTNTAESRVSNTSSRSGSRHGIGNITEDSTPVSPRSPDRPSSGRHTISRKDSATKSSTPQKKIAGNSSSTGDRARSAGRPRWGTPSKSDSRKSSVSSASTSVRRGSKTGQPSHMNQTTSSGRRTANFNSSSSNDSTDPSTIAVEGGSHRSKSASTGAKSRPSGSKPTFEKTTAAYTAKTKLATEIKASNQVSSATTTDNSNRREHAGSESSRPQTSEVSMSNTSMGYDAEAQVKDIVKPRASSAKATVSRSNDVKISDQRNNYQREEESFNHPSPPPKQGHPSQSAQHKRAFSAVESTHIETNNSLNTASKVQSKAEDISFDMMQDLGIQNSDGVGASLDDAEFYNSSYPERVTNSLDKTTNFPTKEHSDGHETTLTERPPRERIISDGDVTIDEDPDDETILTVPDINVDHQPSAAASSRPQSRKLYLGADHTGINQKSFSRTPKSAGPRYTGRNALSIDGNNGLESSGTLSPGAHARVSGILRKSPSFHEIRQWRDGEHLPDVRPPSRQSSAFPFHLTDKLQKNPVSNNVDSAKNNVENLKELEINEVTTSVPEGMTIPMVVPSNGDTDAIDPTTHGDMNSITIGTPSGRASLRSISFGYENDDGESVDDTHIPATPVNRPPSRQKLAAQHLFGEEYGNRNPQSRGGDGTGKEVRIINSVSGRESDKGSDGIMALESLSHSPDGFDGINAVVLPTERKQPISIPDSASQVVSTGLPSRGGSRANTTNGYFQHHYNPRDDGFLDSESTSEQAPFKIKVNYGSKKSRNHTRETTSAPANATRIPKKFSTGTSFEESEFSNGKSENSNNLLGGNAVRRSQAEQAEPDTVLSPLLAARPHSINATLVGGNSDYRNSNKIPTRPAGGSAHTRSRSGNETGSAMASVAGSWDTVDGNSNLFHSPHHLPPPGNHSHHHLPSALLGNNGAGSRNVSSSPLLMRESRSTSEFNSGNSIPSPKGRSLFSSNASVGSSKGATITAWGIQGGNSRESPTYGTLDPLMRPRTTSPGQVPVVPPIHCRSGSPTNFSAVYSDDSDDLDFNLDDRSIVTEDSGGGPEMVSATSMHTLALDSSLGEDFLSLFAPSGDQSLPNSSLFRR